MVDNVEMFWLYNFNKGLSKVFIYYFIIIFFIQCKSVWYEIWYAKVICSLLFSNIIIIEITYHKDNNIINYRKGRVLNLFLNIKNPGF